MDGQTVDILCRAAFVWNELTEYRYVLTYGYKKQLYTVNLTFSLEDFPHLAGFQYLRDVSLPRYNLRKTVDRILNHKITYEQIIKAGSGDAARCDYLCCSAFTKGDRDYECNQRKRTILKKERLHISSQESTILYDRLTSIENNADSIQMRTR